MKKIYSGSDPLLVHHLKNLLERENIQCGIAREHLGGGAGELPPIECWPELWCADADERCARALIELALSAGNEAPSPWTCPQCAENIEQQFTRCWNCLTVRPD